MKKKYENKKCIKCGHWYDMHEIYETETHTWSNPPCGGTKSFKYKKWYEFFK